MSTADRFARLNEQGRPEFAPLLMSAEEREAKGFLSYEEKERPEGIHNYKPVYVESGGKVVRDWEAYPNFAEIDRLSKVLAATDYRVIKCYELSLVGAETPYDVNVLHDERQAVRDKINQLKECN
jgi:hypothetical protein